MHDSKHAAADRLLTQVGLPEDMLPEELTDELLQDEDFLQALHKVLMDVHVVAGELVCPESGRRFPIAEGIPNLLIEESECPRDDK
jgi:multifunctional methyltransferase subunit TRM112